MPMTSELACSTATKTLARPSRMVIVCVMSVPHISLTLSVMIVPSCGLVSVRPTRGGASGPFSRITRRTRRGLVRTVLAEHIRQHIAASRLHGEGYRKLWARLRVAGVRTSPRRVRRVMRENGLLAPHRVGRTETKPHDGTIITDKVNEMWGTDMTQTITIRE